MKRLVIRPEGREELRRSFTLDGVSVTLRVYWIELLGAWYLDLLDGSGEEVAVGVPIAPGSRLALPGAGESIPPGRLVALGPDPYPREALGDAVQLYYVTAAELA